MLGASLCAVFGMLALNGLPRLHHPIFSAPAFRRASRDRFFLCLEAEDPLFDSETARALLDRTGPLAVHEVER